jgi:hypothetical protein
MGYGIAFDPLVSTPLLIAAGIAALLVALLLLISRSRSAVIRSVAFAAAFLALANPSFTREEREPLSSVAAVVIDKSASQHFGDRTAEAEKARAAIVERLGKIPGREVRTVEAGDSEEGEGTRLFTALNNALSDVPPERIAGAIFVTDGRVHDVPDPAALGFQAPVHGIITGRPDERDRRVALTATPRFGIVGQKQTVGYRVEDVGAPRGARVQITVRRDGEIISRPIVTAGEQANVQVDIPHAGQNIVEIEAAALDGELTPLNNRVAVSIDGVREKLRVLLVSGEPHSGERTWRNLLKSDANVDLVHFTILRPPEKQDGTPINELSLIAFPTRELFQQKIKEFQLIIFDRYAQQGVLPLIYFDNIVKYVREGGAVLIAAGSDYASAASIYRSPLENILPAEPTGHVTEAPFRPMLTEAGKRHPVTRALPGSESTPPHWSRWFRLVDARTEQGGTALMNGANNNPLLVLSRQGEGRVALLLSDHIWLWARGYEGGGPHLDLMRRLSHWLMKEPELEEERLTLKLQGKQLAAERRTMRDEAAPVTVTTPSGDKRTLNLSQVEPGLFRALTPATELGLWRATDGQLSTLVNVGPINPLEFAAVTSTKDVLSPIAKATGGGVWRMSELGAPAPRIVGVHSGERFAGSDWLGLKLRDASIVRGIGLFPLFAGLSGLLLLLAAVSAAWAREGR